MNLRLVVYLMHLPILICNIKQLMESNKITMILLLMIYYCAQVTNASHILY